MPTRSAHLAVAAIVILACVPSASPLPAGSAALAASPVPAASPLPTEPAPDEVRVVERYGVFERTFPWDSDRYADPWSQVRLDLALTSPSGGTVRVDGFFVQQDTWKARFAPSELGRWSWTATFTDGGRSETTRGAFNVMPGTSPGFVRPSATNPDRWVFDDGSPYYPIGIGDCLLDIDRSGSPIDNWGFDGGFRTAGTHELGRLVDIDTYLAAYAAAGVDLFRWSVDNCAFKLADPIDPKGPRFLVQEGIWGDTLVAKLRQYGFRVYMTIFGFEPPFPSASPGSPEMDAVKRYVRYVVDRYGAYVDFWELMNEARVPDAWTVAVATYLREIDPYRHPISTSWERPDVSVIEIDSPHWYERESEFDSDGLTAHRIAGWKAAGKPVIVGEQGNTGQNWDDRSALRMRLRSWTALFTEAVLVFWNSSFAKDFPRPRRREHLPGAGGARLPHRLADLRAHARA